MYNVSKMYNKYKDIKIITSTENEVCNTSSMNLSCDEPYYV